MFDYNNLKVSNSYRVFLLEIIVSIFFFAVFAGVTTKVFAGAYQNNKKAMEINNATIFTQDIMETLTANNGDINKTINEFGFDPFKKGFVLLLDKNMGKTKDNYTYLIFLNFTEEKSNSGRLVWINIKVYSATRSEIYSLSNDVYIPNQL